MSEEPPLSRLQRAQRLAARLGHRDFDEVVDLLSTVVEYRVGGNDALASVFRGPAEVSAHMRDLADRTDQTFDAIKWEDWLVGDDYVGALVRVHAQGHGAAITTRLMILLGFDPDDRISELTVFFEDPSAAARFFGR
jgi:hypothetical protein